MTFKGCWDDIQRVLGTDSGAIALKDDSKGCLVVTFKECWMTDGGAVALYRTTVKGAWW